MATPEAQEVPDAEVSHLSLQVSAISSYFVQIEDSPAKHKAGQVVLVGTHLRPASAVDAEGVTGVGAVGQGSHRASPGRPCSAVAALLRLGGAGS